MDDPNPLVIAGRVAVTPQGSLRITENVILERSASGRLRTFNPENLTVGEGMEVVQNHSRRNLFLNNDEDDDIFEPRLAQMLEVDSASEVEDDDMTVEELQEILEEDEDLVPEEDEVGEEFVWSEDFSSFRGSREELHESAGPKIEGIDPLHIFSQIWDQPLMESIRNETNKYACETLAPLYEEENGLPPNSRLNNWVETSVSELYRLIAVIVLMAMCVRGRIDEYWSTGILGMPGFRRLMQRDRFLLLMRHLHFVDNDSIAGCRGSERRLAKIRPLLDYLNMKFKTSYTPHQEVSIDESLLLWKGHLSWIQCIRSKAARFGIKSYELCESITGYVIKMIIYTGKGTSVRGSLFGFESLTAKTVLQLFTEYLGKGYTLFMDNFYNSLALTRFLKRNKTDVVGTLNRRRINCPPAIKAVSEKRVPRGTVVSQHCGDISVVAWKDSNLSSDAIVQC